MSYEKLLDDLETLQKSYAADEDDQKIQAAAADGDADNADEELDADGKPVAKKEDGDEDKAEGNPFAKSFNGTTADGQEFEAIDGTELIKSLNERIDVMAKTADTEKSDLTKSLTILVDMIKGQGVLIKSLNERIEVLAKSGAGRKSVTAPTMDMQKSLSDGAPLNAQGFMLKANAAFDAGRITGKDLTICDVALRHGAEIDQAIVSKIMA